MDEYEHDLENGGSRTRYRALTGDKKNLRTNQSQEDREFHDLDMASDGENSVLSIEQVN